MRNNKIILLLIIFLTLFSLGLRLYRLSEPNHYYFDEVYHVVTVRAYANNDAAAYNPFSPPPEEDTAYDWLHPPLAKLIQAASVKIVGDNPLGWRLSGVIVGVGLIGAVFVLAYLLFGPLVAIFASTVVAFENLAYVMSRITMNDIFITFFTVVAFIFATLYVSSGRHSEPGPELDSGSSISESRDSIASLQNDRKKVNLYLVLTGVFLGMAVASKWTGVYATVAVLIYVIWQQLKNRQLDAKIVLLVLIPPIVYLLSYGQFWLQGHSVKEFTDLHKQIWWYQNRGDLEHSYATTPLFCMPKGLTGPKTFCPWFLDVRPVYLSYEQYDDKAGYIYNLGNPLILWTGIGAIGYLLWEVFKNRQNRYLLILLGYFIFWLPWIFSPRILFFHHYLPSIPFLSIALGLVLAKLYQTKLRYLAIIMLLIFIAVFFYFYPISSGYPIEPKAIDRFMWLGTWR